MSIPSQDCDFINSVDSCGSILLQEDKQLVRSLSILSKRIHENAVKKGFWEKTPNKGELISLIHREASEITEALRKNDPVSLKIGPEFTEEEEELADVIIRTLDYAAGFNLRVGEAILAKMKYNKSRPYKHGKKF